MDGQTEVDPHIEGVTGPSVLSPEERGEARGGCNEGSKPTEKEERRDLLVRLALDLKLCLYNTYAKARQPTRLPRGAGVQEPQVLDYIMGHDGVWMATGEEIADWYLAECQDHGAWHRAREH